jgi:alcohol dehydrogenase (NADP+)
MGTTNQATSGHRASGKIDPKSIPRRQLYTGAANPAIGLGTFGSDSIPAARIAEAVRGAAEIAYRHFDCASVHGNEPEIGQALKAIVAQRIRREDLWITSKLWNDTHGEMDVIALCRRSLFDLRPG